MVVDAGRVPRPANAAIKTVVLGLFIAIEERLNGPSIPILSRLFATAGSAHRLLDQYQGQIGCCRHRMPPFI
jgi:hypothetical protein